MSEENTLPYFHGALLDDDVDKLLESNGDFLLQTKFEQSKKKNKLVLAVKHDHRTIRVPISRLEKGYRISGRSFPTMNTLIKYYHEHSIEINGIESLLLKRPIKKGKFQLNHSDIKIIKKIGYGAYGTVYKGVLLKNLCTVAVKRIDCADKSEQALIDLMKEARVMQLYDHINVVKFYGFIVDREPFLLVMEYCKDGSVEDKLKQYGHQLSIESRIDMACQIARGLEDIATRNCLLSGTIVKLADFGMCRATLVYKIDLSKPQNVRWLAPETRFCTDMFAFAITLWELFTIPYTHPYSAWKAYKVKEKVMAGYRLPSPNDMPESMITIMRRCWDHDPSKRPTAKQAREYLEEIYQNLATASPHTAVLSQGSSKLTASKEDDSSMSTSETSTRLSRERRVIKREKKHDDLQAQHTQYIILLKMPEHYSG
ncbi:SH2 domain protein [Onchocerca flexuosa]|uniref:Tyrosine-protein kinase n=1 Tax=Onchocerca flexuosa TaxID=387005 RepID=A0A238BW53_9BILA|nr:SH2 domain protein [Onchocerca flexuosa]